MLSKIPHARKKRYFRILSCFEKITFKQGDLNPFEPHTEAKFKNRSTIDIWKKAENCVLPQCVSNWNPVKSYSIILFGVYVALKIRCVILVKKNKNKRLLTSQKTAKFEGLEKCTSTHLANYWDYVLSR